MKNPLYIFCGGGSRRMGRDKAQLLLDDEPLLARQVRRAEPFFSDITLLSGPNFYDSDYRHLPDAITDAGPLSGLLAALKEAEGKNDQIAVIPVDVPFLSDETLMKLSVTSLASGTDALLLRHKDRIQPLAGVYRTGLTASLEPFLECGQRMVMKFVESLQSQYLDVDEEELRNINYPDDYLGL